MIRGTLTIEVLFLGRGNGTRSLWIPFSYLSTINEQICAMYVLQTIFFWNPEMPFSFAMSVPSNPSIEFYPIHKPAAVTKSRIAPNQLYNVTLQRSR